MHNPERWWFSLFHSAKFACGWVFGPDADAAFAAALAQAKRDTRLPAGSRGTLTLQRDVLRAEYFDREVTL